MPNVTANGLHRRKTSATIVQSTTVYCCCLCHLQRHLTGIPLVTQLKFTERLPPGPTHLGQHECTLFIKCLLIYISEEARITGQELVTGMTSIFGSCDNPPYCQRHCAKNTRLACLPLEHSSTVVSSWAPSSRHSLDKSSGNLVPCYLCAAFEEMSWCTWWLRQPPLLMLWMIMTIIDTVLMQALLPKMRQWRGQPLPDARTSPARVQREPEP